MRPSLNCKSRKRQSARTCAAFSLFELVGVLAVIAILATLILSATVKHLDRVAGDLESAQLQNLAQAFQNSATRNRYIPGPANWAAALATELGVTINSVTNNSRNSRRVLLVDPLLQIGVNNGGLPYSQNITGSVVTVNGATVPPINPRLMLLSTIGPAFPSGLTDGVNNDFNTIWTNADGTLPSVSSLSGWRGTTNDLKVQRINLAPLFVHLLLESIYTNASGLGRYGINRAGTNQVPASLGVDAYFLKGTVLELYANNGQPNATDSEQILTLDSHFVYTLGMWRGSIYDGPAVTAPLMGIAAAQFLSSPYNPNTSTVNITYPVVVSGMKPIQQTLVDNYALYMRLYVLWAQAGFPVGSGYDATYKTPLLAISKQTSDIATALVKNVVQGSCPPP